MLNNENYFLWNYSFKTSKYYQLFVIQHQQKATAKSNIFSAVFALYIS